MALCRLPAFFCNIHKLPSLLDPATPYCTRLTISCSLKKPRDNKKVRASRATKSNEDLCNDLREFISMVGLPENCVPSMKELSRHGRKDLANLVRRRGYKFMADLLLKTANIECNEEGIEQLILNKLTVEDNLEYFSPENRESGNSVENKGLPPASAIDEHFSITNGFVLMNPGPPFGRSIESSHSSWVHEKAAKFIKSGELEMVKGEDEDGRYFDTDGEREVQFGGSYDETSIAGAPSNLDFDVTSKQVSLLSECNSQRGDTVPSEGLDTQDLEKNSAVESVVLAAKSDNKIEINRLKLMLHHKEVELAQLEQQLEKKKVALEVLQTKANTEIGNRQRVISATDAELHEVEESLAGLNEVQIEYRGNGETVEVAGSFNGWHHRIKMDLEPSSKSAHPTGSRENLVWSTVLWLYPGIYEIKFIVDGQWRIDPEKECAKYGYIENNILRVDK